MVPEQATANVVLPSQCTGQIACCFDVEIPLLHILLQLFHLSFQSGFVKAVGKVQRSEITGNDCTCELQKSFPFLAAMLAAITAITNVCDVAQNIRKSTEKTLEYKKCDGGTILHCKH